MGRPALGHPPFPTGPTRPRPLMARESSSGHGGGRSESEPQLPLTGCVTTGHDVASLSPRTNERQRRLITPAYLTGFSKAQMRSLAGRGEAWHTGSGQCVSVHSSTCLSPPHRPAHSRKPETAWCTFHGRQDGQESPHPKEPGGISLVLEEREWGSLVSQTFSCSEK